MTPSGTTPEPPAESFDWTAAESPSNAVVDAVSVVSDVEPTELTPLYDAVDPDALDSIFTRRGPSPVPPEGRVEFPYNGHRIVVKANGRGYVYDLSVPDRRTVRSSDGDVAASGD